MILDRSISAYPIFIEADIVVAPQNYMLSKPVRKTKSGAPRGACASAPDLVFRTGSGVASTDEFPSF